MNDEPTTARDELERCDEETSVAALDLINLLGTVDIPILLLDRARKLRGFTPRARGLLNVVPSDLGRALAELRPTLQIEDLDTMVAEVIETVVSREAEVQDRHGRWHRMSIRPYKNADNRIDGALLSLFEIDDLKRAIREAERARAEAEQANRAKDQFLAIVSHELRSPLTSVLLYAQRLRAGEVPSGDLPHAGEVIERSARHQLRLIEDLLEVSRIVTGKLKIEMKLIDPRAWIRAEVEAASASARRKSITLEVDLPDAHPTVAGDAARLQQVLGHLLTNAIKFTPSGGKIALRLEVAGGRVRLSVADTGIGIEAPFLEHIFTTFTQEDTSNTRAHGGLGLGLAIARHIVEAHGGWIHASSAGRGKGTAFVVDLPLVSAASRGASAEVAGSSSPAASRLDALRGVRVLVVDDEAAIRELVTDLLARRGARTARASSAAEGMTAMKRFRPQVLVCDVAMPREDGYSFLQRVRALGERRGGNIPAIALTALATDEDRRRTLAAGFQAHLAKPIDIAELVDAVATLAPPPPHDDED